MAASTQAEIFRNIKSQDGTLETFKQLLSSNMNSYSFLPRTFNNPESNYKQFFHYQDENGKTLLHWAAYMGKKDIVEFLVTAGHNVHAVDIYGYPAIFYAAEQGKDAALFLAEQATLEELRLAFIGAASSNNVSIAKKIFEIAKSKGGFDINDTLKGKATALHFAAQYKDLEFAEFLISNGADPNQSYRSGYGTHSGFSGPSTVISYTLREHGDNFAQQLRDISAKYSPKTTPTSKP